MLATVEDDTSGQLSTGAGKVEFLLGEAQERVAVVLCCRVPWRGGDEEDGALGAGGWLGCMERQRSLELEGAGPRRS